MLNVLTIDIEDYWSVFSRDWLGIDAEPSIAVLRNTEWFLETLKRFNVRATVFVLGEVAKKFLVLIKKNAGLSPRKFVASFPKFTTIWCIQRAIRYYWIKRCPIYNYTARQLERLYLEAPFPHYQLVRCGKGFFGIAGTK